MMRLKPLQSPNFFVNEVLESNRLIVLLLKLPLILRIPIKLRYRPKLTVCANHDVLGTSGIYLLTALD